MSLQLTTKELRVLLSAVNADSLGTWGDERSKVLDDVMEAIVHELRTRDELGLYNIVEVSA